MRFVTRLSAWLFACVAFAAPAFAHPGHDIAPGFISGFEHPYSGPDHLLAMFAVGLLAAQLGGRAIWLVPAAFVATMIAGAAAGFAGLQLPGVEYAILISVCAIALPVALAFGVPVWVAMTYVAVFAFFHGFAHGAEIPASANAVSYVCGFAFATAGIHALGIGVGILAGKMRGPSLRIAGAATAIAGVALFVS